VKIKFAYGRGALFKSKLLDMSGIDESSERKQCRSDNNPELLLLGKWLRAI
jgi:hypothetical protein